MTAVVRLFSGLLTGMFFLIAASAQPGVETPAPSPASETIIYDIKQFGMTVGEAVWQSQGVVDLGGEKAYLMTFTSKAPQFRDEEKIYLHPQTFLPLRVERILNIFGKKEHIIEYYNAAEGSVKIRKTVRGKTTEQILRKGRRLENIYGFICRYRKTGKFVIGENMRIDLPMREVAFELIQREALEISGKNYNTYYLQSNPAKYKVWFDQSPERIPLRIDGTVGLGKTAMVMREYRHPDL